MLEYPDDYIITWKRKFTTGTFEWEIRDYQDSLLYTAHSGGVGLTGLEIVVLDKDGQEEFAVKQVYSVFRRRYAVLLDDSPIGHMFQSFLKGDLFLRTLEGETITARRKDKTYIHMKSPKQMYGVLALGASAWHLEIYCRDHDPSILALVLSMNVHGVQLGLLPGDSFRLR